jgi:hypothetical protein
MQPKQIGGRQSNGGLSRKPQEATKASKEAAATKIQSVQRASKARREVASRRQKEVLANVHPHTTIWELWEILQATGGHTDAGLPITVVVRLFQRCRATGINGALVEVVPMCLEPSEHAPEDLSVEEVAYLCKLLIADPMLSEQVARESLAAVKDELRCPEGSMMPGENFLMGLRSFSRFIRIVSFLMRIDDVYLITHMAWCLVSRFEMTDALYTLVMKQCAARRRRSAHMGECCKKILAVVYQEDDGFLSHVPPAQRDSSFDADTTFTFLNLQYMCFNADIIHEHHLSGLTYEEMSALFGRVTEDMSSLLKIYSGKRSAQLKQKKIIGRKGSSTNQGGSSQSHIKMRAESQLQAVALHGRTELAILLEEMAASKLMRLEFASPLEMVVSLVQRANNFASQELPK